MFLFFLAFGLGAIDIYIGVRYGFYLPIVVGGALMFMSLLLDIILFRCGRRF